MNVRYDRKTKMTSIKLIQRDVEYLESARGLCTAIANNIQDRAGKAAEQASDALGTVLELLTAEPPKKLVPKE